MKQAFPTRKIIQQVAHRLRWAMIGQQFYFWLLVTGTCYGVALIANRLLGLPLWGIDTKSKMLATLCIVPIAAIVVSLWKHRRPTLADAARRMDQHEQTKDLFLTYSMLDQTAGDYQPLVAQVADQQAHSVLPQKVIPLRWTRQSTRGILLGLLLVLAIFYLPQLDPLGQVAQAKRVEQDKQLRMDDRRSTSLRVEQVLQEQRDKAESSQVEQAIDEMTKSLRHMKPGVAAANLKKINQHQRRLGKQWKGWREKKLSQMLSVADSRQNFGGRRSEKFRQWQKELQAGKAASLRKELSKLGDELKAIAAEKDPGKRNERIQKLKERLQEIEQFASKNAGSPELAAAMQRAMRQLEATQKDDGDFSESIDDMLQSLDLAKLELEQIAKSAQELQKLEESLKVLQMAKQLDADGQMNGEACSQCQSLADYADLFEQMMGAGEGSGPGMGNRGFGEGGEAPEDNSVTTQYQTERSRSALRAGKVLLSMQSKGISDSGEVEENYQTLVQQVKQGVSEAILQEQIPPGYHDAIRGYFDTVRDPPSQDPPREDTVPEQDK